MKVKSILTSSVKLPILVRNAIFVYAIRIICIAFPFVFVGCSSEFKDPPFSSSSKESYPLNKSDSIAMVNIYRKIGPFGEKWDLKDITTWGGVEAALDLTSNENRITGFFYNGDFFGDIPEEFRQLTELRKLGLVGGNLSGEIPAWIGELSHLEYLSIMDNKISGKIPSEVGKLVNLKYLNLSMNNLEGELPESLGKLVNIVRLTITDTKIKGEIPNTLSKLKKAIVIDLDNNQLSGRFPIEILTNERLYVGCNNNNITELPFEIWRDDFPGSIPDLQKNKLSGVIPDSIKSFKKWKTNKGFVGGQKEGYGYTNYNN